MKSTQRRSCCPGHVESPGYCYSVPVSICRNPEALIGRVPAQQDERRCMRVHRRTMRFMQRNQVPYSIVHVDARYCYPILAYLPENLNQEPCTNS